MYVKQTPMFPITFCETKMNMFQMEPLMKADHTMFETQQRPCYNMACTAAQRNILLFIHDVAADSSSRMNSEVYSAKINVEKSAFGCFNCKEP